MQITKFRKTRKKYNNRTIKSKYGKFDSVKEYKRFIVLQNLEKEGKIQNLRLQVKFLLIPSVKVNGKTNRKIEYIADFVYTLNGKTIVEDVKGFKTSVYKIKKKLFEWKYPQYKFIET